MDEYLPTISIVIPTLNAANVLSLCLDAICSQDYPRDHIEIIIADGGSTDRTLDIAKERGCRILKNPLITAEAGKAVGVKAAKNDLIALIDSDNILPEVDWLNKMVRPFVDPEIIGAEPIRFTYRREDGYITRYCALIGMNDPLCLFLGNYDRYCTITGKWTGIKVKEEKKDGYVRIELEPDRMPTIGANGTMLRRSIFSEYEIGDYLFDIDLIYDLSTKKRTLFAKVDVGIIHIYSRTASNFIKKQRRRIKDYSYYNKLGVRKYPWKQSNVNVLYFTLCNITVVPLIYQGLRGFVKKPDGAWFFHVPACWFTFVTYLLGTLTSNGDVIADRKEWKQ